MDNPWRSNVGLSRSFFLIFPSHYKDEQKGRQIDTSTNNNNNSCWCLSILAFENSSLPPLGARTRKAAIRCRIYKQHCERVGLVDTTLSQALNPTGFKLLIHSSRLRGSNPRPIFLSFSFPCHLIREEKIDIQFFLCSSHDISSAVLSDEEREPIRMMVTITLARSLR